MTWVSAVDISLHPTLPKVLAFCKFWHLFAPHLTFVNSTVPQVVVSGKTASHAFASLTFICTNGVTTLPLPQLPHALIAILKLKIPLLPYHRSDVELLLRPRGRPTLHSA